MTFNGKQTFSCTDLEMDILKLCKAPVLEQEVPSEPWPWMQSSIALSSQPRLGKPNVIPFASQLPQSLPSFQPPKYQLLPH